MTAKEAWRIYNFINEYKNGNFGIVTLQEALDRHLDSYEQPKPLKEQIGETI